MHNWAWSLGLFLFVVLRGLKASFQVYSMYSCLTPFVYLFKSLHILSNMQLWRGKPPVTITEKWNQSIHSSVRTVISPNIPFIILTEQHYCPVIFGAEPEAAATAEEDDSLVYSTITQMELFNFPRSCNYSASDK